MEATPLLLFGRPIADGSNGLFEVRAPWDDEILGRVPACGEAEAATACRHAVAVLGRAPTAARIGWLERAADLLAAESALFASAICREVGKPIVWARGEVDRGVETLRWSAAAARESSAPRGVPAAASAGHERTRAWVERVPRGVVVAVTPFNFPLNLLLHKLGPAIAAGCPVVAKPAPQGILVALGVHDLLVRAGMPADFVQILADQDGAAARAACGAPETALISFTGSARVGSMLAAQYPDKRIELELGSQSPVIVDRGQDPAVWAPRIAEAAFAQAGQSCIAVQRVLVPEDELGPWSDALAAAAEAVVCGDPADPAVVCGPMIRPAGLDRLEAWLAEATDAGARVLCGGRRDGRVFRPTIVTGAPATSRLRREEIFGPVATLETWRTHGEAIASANDSPQRIHVGVVTGDLHFAKAAIGGLDFGGVLIGEVPTRRLDQQPYGGVGAAGEAREGPASAMQAMTREKFVRWG